MIRFFLTVEKKNGPQVGIRKNAAANAGEGDGELKNPFTTSVTV